MAAIIAILNYPDRLISVAVRPMLGIFLLLAANVLLLHAQVITSQADNTIVVEDASGQEIFAYGKNVIVRGQAQGVLAIGGNITIEGRIEGDVATIGGSITQLHGAYVGGDVFVLGGQYRPESPTPLRVEGKETVMVAGYEQELRDLAQNPLRIFSPTFSLRFIAQRALSVLFWFIVTMGLTTIAPGAVSRAIVRFNLSTLKIVAIGFGGLVGTTIGVIASISLLPNYVSAVLGLMALMLLLLSYVFGRVALHLSFGQMLQKRLLPEGSRSETLAIFLGVLVWTLLLSVPYVWSLAIVALFAAGIGLVLTARSRPAWKAGG